MLLTLAPPIALRAANRFNSPIQAAIVAALARLRHWAVIGGLALLAGCSTLPRNAPPPELMNETSIPGLPDIRAPAGRQSAHLYSTTESANDKYLCFSFCKIWYYRIWCSFFR